MTGREKIEAAFSPDGSPEIPVTIPYETILIRDLWPRLTGVPWWSRFSPEMETQLAWQREIIARLGQDWMRLPFVPTRAEREETALDVRPEGVFLVNRRTGEEEGIPEPVIGGAVKSPAGDADSETVVENPDQIDRLITLPGNTGEVLAEGEDDLAKKLIEEFGGEKYPYCPVLSPLWRCYNLWGFEDMMVMIASRPDLVAYAVGKWLEVSLRDVRRAAALGARGIWVEECFTDMISPAAYEGLNLPALRKLIGEIRDHGMHSIYYYCGNPAGRLNLLMESGADALAFEEGKKGFEIDIRGLAEAVGGKRVLLGNLDSIGVLQNGSDTELRAEIRRQTAAGRRNRSRFIMGLGSPVTPNTPVDRVRRYCEMAREMGGREAS